MHEARIAFSRAGFMKRTVLATSIASREHARKLWPLVTPEVPYRLLTYVSPSFNEQDALVRRGHFRLLPGSRFIDFRSHFDSEEESRRSATFESEEHRRAKEMIAAALNDRLKAGRAMPWAFRDLEASDYHLSGNLLLGAESISTEMVVKTAFGSTYRLDVGILSKPIGRRPLILGGVEIERDHAFDGRKALISKSQAFPLISVDITGMALSEITPEWADRALTLTTASNEDGRRATYIYLHDLLYPLHVQLPAIRGASDGKHQYLVFSDNASQGRLLDWTKKLGQALGLREGQHYSVALVRAKSEQSKTMLINAGEVVGVGWEAVNPDQCVRLTVQKPKSLMDVSSHLFHLTLARLLLVELDALVGYKYMNGILNEDKGEDVWIHDEWLPESKSWRKHRILPKRLAEPHSQILSLLQNLHPE